MAADDSGICRTCTEADLADGYAYDEGMDQCFKIVEHEVEWMGFVISTYHETYYRDAIDCSGVGPEEADDFVGPDIIESDSLAPAESDEEVAEELGVEEEVTIEMDYDPFVSAGEQTSNALTDIEQWAKERAAASVRPASKNPSGPFDELDAVGDICESETPPDPISGGTHYLQLEDSSTDVYNRIAISTRRRPKVGQITNHTRVYLYPEEEFIGDDCEWCKIRPIEGDLADVDGYVYCSDLRPLEGTSESLTVECPPAPDLKAFVPNWILRGACSPWYNARTQKYCTTVTTEHTTIDEETPTESPADSIKSEALSAGVKQILEYYSRRPDGISDLDEAADHLIDNSYHVAKAEEIYIGPRPNAKVKVLVSVAAKYLNAIPRKIPDFFDSRGCTRTVLFNSFTIEDDFGLAEQTLSNIEDKLATFTGTIKDFSPRRESKRISKSLSAIKELISVNGFELRKDSEDLIEVAVDCDFKPLQVVMYQDGIGTNLDVGFNSFKASPGIKSPRTMHYLVQMHNMNSYMNMQRLKTTPFNWLEYCTNYTFPGLDIRFTSKMTPGINTKQLRLEAKAAIEKFNSVPFKGPEQLKFEAGKLTSPDFLKNMSLARADFEIPIGDPVLTNLDALLDEINTLDDLFGKFLGKVEIPKLIEMAMSSIMDQLEFPDLFDAMLGAIMGQFSLEVILEDILANLDLSVQLSIFQDLLEGFDLPTECYMTFFEQLGITIPSLQAAIPADIMSAELAEILSVDATYSEEEGFALMAELDPSSLIDPIIQMILKGIPEVTFEASDLTLSVDIEGNPVGGIELGAIEGTEDMGDLEATVSTAATIPGKVSKLPKITPTKIKKAFFATCEDCAGINIGKIATSVTAALKTQVALGGGGTGGTSPDASASGGGDGTAGGSGASDSTTGEVESIAGIGDSAGIDIDFLKNLPPISAAFDILLGDPNLNLNMEIPSLPGISLEMPSLNVDIPSIPSISIPTINLPDNIPTLDIMGYVFDAMLSGIQSAIESALVEMAKSVIRSLLGGDIGDLADLSFGEANIGDLLGSSVGSLAAAESQINQTFEPLGIAPDGSTTATEEEITEALSSCTPAAGDTLNVGTPIELLDDISDSLTITETAALLRGQPSERTCEAIQNIVSQRYHNMAPVLMDCERLADVFGEIGASVDLGLIDKAIPEKRKIANKLDYLCGVLESPVDSDAYKAVMSNKGLTPEQVEEQLQAEKDRQKQALEDLASLLADVKNNSVLDGVVPPVYPEECGMPSLMPPDSEMPEINFVNELAVGAMYAGVEMAWKAESTSYFENFLSSSAKSSAVPFLYDWGNTKTGTPARPMINPQFEMLYSQGYPLCAADGTIYEDADNLAAIKMIAGFKNPWRRTEQKLTYALKQSTAADGDEESEYYNAITMGDEGGVTDYYAKVMARKFEIDVSSWSGDGVSGHWGALTYPGTLWADDKNYGYSGGDDDLKICSAVNVQQSELESTANSTIESAYYHAFNSFDLAWRQYLLTLPGALGALDDYGVGGSATSNEFKYWGNIEFRLKNNFWIEGSDPSPTNACKLELSDNQTSTSNLSASVSITSAAYMPCGGLKTISNSEDLTDKITISQPSADFYTGIPKQTQLVTQIMYDNYISDSYQGDQQRPNIQASYGDGALDVMWFQPGSRPAMANSVHVAMCYEIFGLMNLAPLSLSSTDRYGQHLSRIKVSEDVFDDPYGLDEERIGKGILSLSVDSLGLYKIEPSSNAPCSGEMVLDPQKAKDDAMDSINSTCPDPAKQKESGKTPLRQGGIAGLIGMTLRAYISDTMLRIFPLLLKLPVNRPSNSLLGLIYDDMIADMKSIDHTYHSNFINEAVTAYSESEDAEEGLTEREIMMKLISKEYDVVVPKIMQNLGAEYSTLESWLFKSFFPTMYPGDPVVYGATEPTATFHFLDDGFDPSNQSDIDDRFDEIADIEIDRRPWVTIGCPTVEVRTSGEIEIVSYLRDAHDGTTTPQTARIVLASANTGGGTSDMDFINAIVESDGYKSLFEYCIPIHEMVSMIALFHIRETTMDAPEVAGAFDATKEELKMAFELLSKGEQEGVQFMAGDNAVAMAEAQDNIGSDIEQFSNNVSTAKLMKKMAADTVPMLIKSMAEKLDPNIKQSKLIRDAATKAGVSMHPVAASLAARPMNIIPPFIPLAMGLPPGLPIGPLGLMYWVLAKPDKNEKRALEEAGAGATGSEAAGTVGASDSSAGSTTSDSEACTPDE